MDGNMESDLRHEGGSQARRKFKAKAMADVKVLKKPGPV